MKNNFFSPLYFILLPIVFVSELVSAQCLSGDCLNGYGRLKCDCGYIYEGIFNNGQKIKGKMIKKEYVYSGDFEFDQPHGKGKIEFADGSSYEGDFKYSQLEGKGKYRSAQGYFYNGEMKAGNFEGIGSKIYEDTLKGINIIQHGEFKGDVLDGLAYLGEFGASHYVGEMQGDKKNGIGILILTFENEEQIIEVGIYKNNKLKKESAPVAINRWQVEVEGINYDINYNTESKRISLKKTFINEDTSVIEFNLKREQAVIELGGRNGKKVMMDSQGNQHQISG